MAISVYEKLGQKITPKSSCSKSSNLSSCLIKLDYTADESTVSSKNDSPNKKSPYLSEEKVKMHTRVTEKKIVHKKTDFVSSFPLAVNIYKANSDEFKLSKRGGKKVKKSVLTLPNEHAPVPQMCTVSDMTESEYFNENKEERKPKTRKKRTTQNNRKVRKSNNVEVYDRDARYCSQLDIDLDSSSTDLINQFTGDGKRKPRRRNPTKKADVHAHDVWAILRNINQFQFVPSPPMSPDSVISAKKRTNLNKKRNSCRDTRFIETCRTEEYAYITNFVDNSRSQSSLDRVTVIDKQEDYQLFCKEVEESVKNCKSKFCRPIQKKNKPKATRKQNVRAITNNVKSTENDKPQVNEEQSNNICIKENDQNNEIKDINIRSIDCIDNQDRNKFCDYFETSQTNIIGKTNFNNLQDNHKLRKKLKTQISGITKVVVSKGNNVPHKISASEEKSRDAVTPIAAQLTLPNDSEIQTTNATESQPQRSKRGKLTNHRNVKDVNNGETKANKAKCNTNAMHKNASNEMEHVLVRNEIPGAAPELKQKRQLKDKMIQFLYKKHHDDDVTREPAGSNTRITENSLADVRTNTTINFDTLKETNPTIDEIEFGKSSPPLKRSWAKGKWASDFIDNVIKKIRSGVYYSSDEKQPVNCKYGKREDSSQTDVCYQKLMKPQSLNTGEGLIKPFSPTSFNTSRYDVKTFNKSQIAKIPCVKDEVVHNKSHFAVLERLKQDNFKQLGDINQIHYRKPADPRNVFNQKEVIKAKSWVEGKWASDFIDNIFKKIKNGVYYSQEVQCLCKSCHTTTDDSSQTEIDNSKLYANNVNNLYSINETVNQQTNSHESLTQVPGFDEAPNELEIETYSKKQIAVKNCVTNVVVQFDVELPNDPYKSLQINPSLSCIPVTVIGSHAKVFKSKTTIINSFLPAELCSIIPLVMHKIIASNTRISLPKLTVGKVESSLSTISELTRCESFEFSKQNAYEICEPRTDLLLNIKSIKIFEGREIPTGLLEMKPNKPKLIEGKCSILPQVHCMALQLYQPLNKIVRAYKKFDLLSYIENLLYAKGLTVILNVPLVINSCQIRCFNGNITVSVGFDRSNVNIAFSKVIKNSVSNKLNNSIEFDQNKSSPDPKPAQKVLDIYTIKPKAHTVERQKSKSEFRSYNNKNKKKGFVKLYKKCKSMSNLLNSKSTISIEKITNSEEFLQALGASRTLSAVIDGNIERKILSSLKEMKNWKSDITQRQALLVLLLANKKDTSNVVRYRPLILQGIAVNRITKASELDMEIEVIERENLNRLSQFEGISYVPASVENQDALLEELQWIAKTTASDYQKTFDESSERLLKSLLEKRKKLNPSYLRVMARYVGLGLLKSSK